MVLKDQDDSILDFTFVSGQLTGQSVVVANGVGIVKLTVTQLNKWWTYSIDSNRFSNSQYSTKYRY